MPPKPQQLRRSMPRIRSSRHGHDASLTPLLSQLWCTALWEVALQAKQEMEKAQHLMAVAKEMHDVAELPGRHSGFDFDAWLKWFPAKESYGGRQSPRVRAEFREIHCTRGWQNIAQHCMWGIAPDFFGFEECPLRG